MKALCFEFCVFLFSDDNNYILVETEKKTQLNYITEALETLTSSTVTSIQITNAMFSTVSRNCRRYCDTLALYGCVMMSITHTVYKQ